jgi:uncharacterized membrane protein YbhN (UPF0104 family)
MIWSVVGVFVLMIMNWSIETIKWKISIEKIQKVSFFKAFKAILSGVSFSVTTPNRMGEYLGRMLYMNEGNRLKAISITIVGSISQLIITLFMGFIGLMILLPKINAAGMISSPWTQTISYGVLAVLIFLLLFYFRLSWLVRWVDRLPGSKRYSYLVKALEEFDTSLLLKLLLLSFSRFLVFVLQYYLAFRLFEVNLSWFQAFWAISVSFLVMAVIPAIAIVELAQRGKILTTVIGIFSSNILGIGLVTVCIWFINLILPAIAGSILIFSIKKIFRNKSIESAG